MRVRIDQWLVKHGLARSRTHAHELIEQGAVYRNGGPVFKASSLVSSRDAVEIRSKKPYVSRGAEKLDSAFQHFNIAVSQAWYVDVGSSTGGFTHYLLNHGAQGVVAIDVGRHQLHESLRHHKQVVVMENTHILSVETLPHHPISYAVIDVSFISLRKVFPKVWSLLSSPKWCLMLFKPQFEVGPAHVKKGGVVKDDEIVQSVLNAFISECMDPGWVIDQCPCGLKGKKKGNQEIWVLAHEKK